MTEGTLKTLKTLTKKKKRNLVFHLFSLQISHFCPIFVNVLHFKMIHNVIMTLL